jgi:hypothetical protein
VTLRGLASTVRRGPRRADSCVLWWERYPSCPSTSSSDIAYRCGVADSGPATDHGATFSCTDQVISDKYEQGLG